MEIPILQDVVVIFLLATVVIFLFKKLNVPSLIGFLITGLIAGPHVLGLVHDAHHEIEILAEIGVILLLFAIGIEFSLKSLVKIKRIVLLGGSLQVFLTIIFSGLIAYFAGLGFEESLFIGFLVALSSTAIVLKITQERSEVATHHGRMGLGILIFQDIIIVPMILIVPMLAGKSTDIGTEMLILAGKTAGMILFTIVFARWVIPWILHQIALVQSQELFLVSVLVIGFAVAWATSAMGLSLALGAFLAGLTISESEYSHQAFGNILPFRDIFTSFFFVSVGMLLDVGFFLENPALILLITLLVILLKAVIAGGVAFILGFPVRTTVIVGLMLSQIGEFSFILSGIGIENELISSFNYQVFLSVTVISMALAPFLFMLAPKAGTAVSKLSFLPSKIVNGLRPLPEIKSYNLENHLIIVGFGFNGRNLAKAAKVSGINYIVIDNDASLVREAQKDNKPIIFGDAVHEAVLEHAGIKNAEVLVVAIGDAVNELAITHKAREMNAKLHIIARTKYLDDVEELAKQGANEVVPEEFETSVEIFSRVLAKYLIPKNDIEKLVSEFRADGYEILRSITLPDTGLEDLKQQLPNVEIIPVRITPVSLVIGKSLINIQLRKNYGVNIVALKNSEGEVITNIPPEYRFKADNVVYLIGEPILLSCAVSLFRDAEPTCPVSLELAKNKQLNLGNISYKKPEFTKKS